MGFDFLGKFRAELLGHAGLELFPLDFGLLVKRFLIGKIMRGGMVELPDQRLLPVRPGVGAGALAVREGEKHERVEVRLIAHDRGEFDGGFRIVQVSLLRHVRESEMMIHQEDERAALRGGKFQAHGRALREKCARFGMRARADRAPGVVQEKGEIKNKRVREFLE